MLSINEKVDPKLFLLKLCLNKNYYQKEDGFHAKLLLKYVSKRY